MYQPDQNEYLDLCRNFKSVPVSLEWPSDTETPITLYAKVAGQQPSFLLESVEGGERLGRYSFIGADAQLILSCHRGVVTIEREGKSEIIPGDPLEAIRRIVGGFRPQPLKNMPRYYGGAVGYLGYDLVRDMEKLPDLKLEETGVPDCMLMVPKINIIIDHVRHTVRLVVNTLPSTDGRAEYRKAVSLLDEVRARITGGDVPARLQCPGESRARLIKSSLSRAEYMERVEKAREYIRAGDILQVVLSRRMDLDFTGDPFAVYRRLRSNNPSPYLYYLEMGKVTIAGSSPEMLVRVEGGSIETRPIAGTRPRGASRQEDNKLAAELLADEKERAEHVMLVDLGRNDAGRVSRPGTVKVPQFMEVEMYSHVMHLVSSVTGDLREGLEGIDALKSCFPAGTVTGAPKVRAMEIIEELEPFRRGPYAGAVGYIGFNGNVDTAITIRTIVFNGSRASVQVGAGIVADSDPAREFTETENKARALINALTGEEDAVDPDYRQL